MSAVVSRTLPADHLTPIRAYAALRAQSPGRSSFLFESAVPGERWGRFAILGYRARAESLYPSGFDPLATLAQDLGEPEEAESLAVGVSRAWVGFIDYSAVHAMHDIEPWPAEAYLGRVVKDATVVVFDSATQTMTIAGPSPGAVNRCAWEMTHGPELQPLPSPDPEALPEQLDASMSDEAYAVRVARAQQRLAAGDADEVVLARSFRSPLRGADPFDVYRALRALAPSRHLYFLDFAESQFAQGLVIAGASGETLAQIERDPATGFGRGTPLVEVLRAGFPAASVIGSPIARASAIIRELEPAPRNVYGGAVGYFGPDGCAELSLGLGTVWLTQGELEVTGSARIGRDSVPQEAAEATRREARAPLAAIRAAHEAQKAREAAAEKAREAAEKQAT